MQELKRNFYHKVVFRNEKSGVFYLEFDLC